jgi:hypothetical protein
LIPEMQQNYTHDADYVEWFSSQFQVNSSLHSHCPGVDEVWWVVEVLMAELVIDQCYSC